MEFCGAPLPHAVRLANLLVASLLRNFWNINADHPPELFLPPVTSGWTGLCSALPTMVLSFVSTYQHQLNHPNPHVQASTHHGLLQALTRFHQDMPCLHQGVLHVCPAHSNNHSLFVIWCHRLSIDVHVPYHELHMPLLQCPLYQATSQWQVEDAHLWMAVPYHSQHRAIRSRWPVCFRPTSFPTPFSDAISALTPHFPDFSLAPPDAVVIQDASWFPTGRHCSGAVALLDVDTSHYTLHRIPIPIFCDNSYQAELYVAWVVLRSQARARWYIRDDMWSLTDSNSYVMALGSGNNSTSCLKTSNETFGHVPFSCLSHLDSTHCLSSAPMFLDCAMDVVDCLAREEGLTQTPRYGWIPEL